MSRLKWDQRFLSLAAHVAAWSKDPSTKVGAVIVDHNRRVVSLGFNGFPRYVSDDEGRYEEKRVKYAMVVHAELNAILSADRRPTSCTLYTTKAPCSECVKAIIQSGISQICSPPYDLVGKWADDANFAITMLREACVEFVELML